MTEQVERVLANWISEALSPVGQIPPGVTPAQWVAANFLRWWRNNVEGALDDSLSQAEGALEAIRSELERLGGWPQFGEALHECIHLADALAHIRAAVLPNKR